MTEVLSAVMRHVTCDKRCLIRPPFSSVASGIVNSSEQVSQPKRGVNECTGVEAADSGALCDDQRGSPTAGRIAISHGR